MIPKGEKEGEIEDQLFYQAKNGELVFLDSLNQKMMLKNAERHENMLPTTISANVVQCTETVIENHRIQKRLRKTVFAPVGSTILTVELDFRNLIDRIVYKEFIPTIKSREAYRKKLESERKEEERLANAPLCKTVKFTEADFMPLPIQSRPEMTEASFPTLESALEFKEFIHEKY